MRRLVESKIRRVAIGIERMLVCRVSLGALMVV